MIIDTQKAAPEPTAAQVALWHALHVQVDPLPHIFTDEVGMKLIGDPEWRQRPEMNPEFSKESRTAVVGRSRFVEDLAVQQGNEGVTQYVLLGAGLDTFAQRRPDFASRIHLFEVDQLGPQVWKRSRLAELGYPSPQWLHFVPVDFEAGQSVWEGLLAAGFDPQKPALVVSKGISPYHTAKANFAALRQLTLLALGSTFAMPFNLSHGPLSRFAWQEILAMGQKAGFGMIKYEVSVSFLLAVKT